MATILASGATGEVATVALVIWQEDYLGYPIAPASLWQLDSDVSVFPLHQLVGREGLRLVFETYGRTVQAPPVGITYEFCSWWLPNAMDAVRDSSAKWERQTYPDDGHAHCLLTYETIAAYADHKEGYRSSHGWITVDAYREFIEQDPLRVRSRWRSIE